MTFRCIPLPIEPFAPLFALDDATLAARGMRRMTVDASPGFPCRVSLVDAAIGEIVLLLPYVHHAVEGPYRASGPIFVRAQARPAMLGVDEVAPVLRTRLLSLRGYDADGIMRHATVAEGRDIEAAIDTAFADPRSVDLHAHNARPGCFACRIERA